MNVKEAAGFLNVSEMTVRRWTNRGTLRCYRIGGRRARRFRIQDLVAFLESDAAASDTKMVRLGFNNFQVPDGAHLTHLCLDRQEALAIAVSYIIGGLSNGETVCVVAPSPGTEKIRSALRQKYGQTGRLEKSGRLFFSHVMDSPEEQVQYVSRMASRSRRRLRIFGDMTWTQARGWGEADLRKLEEASGISPPRRTCCFFASTLSTASQAEKS